MDSFEVNKIIAAVLLVALVVIGIGKISGIIFYVEKPKTPGYSVEIEQVASKGVDFFNSVIRKVMDEGTLIREEDRIKTTYVDQMKPSTFDDLKHKTL